MQHPLPTQSLFAPLNSLSDDERDVDERGDDERDDGESGVGDGRAVEADGACEPPPVARNESTAPLPSVAEIPRTYVCPGEKHAIPRSIHLARLAAFYPNCRDCEHRSDTGQLPRSMIGRLEQSARRVARTSPFRDDGIRGEYLNQLTRKTAARIAAAVAERLWDDRPFIGHSPSSERDVSPPSSRRIPGPTVVIGQDSRSSSPDICVGVSASLRRMGCEVVDVGRVSRPCLTFSVEHLQAAAGIFVTGSGCRASWTGLDIVGEGGVPWSMNGTLSDIEQRGRREVSRPTRQGGSQRFFDASLPYRASLLKHYQELRPQRVVCACSEPAVFDTLVPLFESLSCELIPQEMVQFTPSADGRKESRVAVISDAMRHSAADSGVLIADDGAALQLFAKDGSRVDMADILRSLLSSSGTGRDLAKVALGPDIGEECREVLSAHGSAIEPVEEGAEPMARWMQGNATPLGVQANGRFWFRDTFPRCDAAVTLGRLLQAIGPDT